MITVTTLRWAPPVAQGLVRDLRVRWALEEAGLPYETKLVSPDDQRSDAYRAIQPWGQVPAYEDEGLSLFESGAIVHHIAERSEALLPSDPEARGRAITWMFAALTSVEPAAMSLFEVDFLGAHTDWAKSRRPAVLGFLGSRLAGLSRWLDGREYLEDRFTAGDLLMSTVLRILRHTDLVHETPHLEAYAHRCEARPAFVKALDAQMKSFADHTPERPS